VRQGPESRAAIGGLAGGIIGALAGGPAGALIGVAVGIPGGGALPAGANQMMT
jgi:hypothetical protein